MINELRLVSNDGFYFSFDAKTNIVSICYEKDDEIEQRDLELWELRNIVGWLENKRIIAENAAYQE